MRTNYRLITRFFTLLWVFASLQSIQSQNEVNKCGPAHSNLEQEMHDRLGDNWGHGFDDLLTDLEIWQQSDWVSLHSIGKSVLGRDLWELKITDSAIEDSEKKVVYIHARTHPAEVQSSWVCNELINFLISDNWEAEILRSHCVFYILPMFNPDGVELEYPRENANGVDLESNWFSGQIEQEVTALRNRFTELMESAPSINLALNLHSAFACKRYFVYHHENGTSYNYTVMEKTYIDAVRNDFPDGIENWDYFVSWTNGTPLKYPESWWWINYAESVLALTYEDMNCEQAGQYTRTAHALLQGIGDYFSIDLINAVPFSEVRDHTMIGYPNPTTSLLNISFELDHDDEVYFYLSNSRGQRVKSQHIDFPGPGTYQVQLDVAELQPGHYSLKMINNGSLHYQNILIIK